MSDTKISALPAVSAAADADRLPVVQGSGAAAETRRATLAQLRTQLLADRPLHVREFGAVGDGTTNDAPAIQAAIDFLAANSGGTLQFGPRRYRLASPVVVNGVSVVLQGAGFTEGPSPADGTWFLIDQTGFTPFTFTGVGARGSAVRDIAVRQTHPAVAAGWAPTDYDWVFRVVNCFGAVDFDNVFLCAVNRGIWCDNSGRLNIQRLRGQVFRNGIGIDNCLDIPRVHHVHFWTFWSSADPVLQFQQANCDAILTFRCDGIFLDDIFVLGARSMLRFAASAAGVTTKFYLGSGYADFVKWSIWIDSNAVTGQIANLTTQGEVFNAAGAALPDSQGIRFTGAQAQIHIGNLRVDSVERHAIAVLGWGNRLDVFSFRAERYNQANDGSPAIFVADSGGNPANQVFLGAPAILGNGNGGPLGNGGTNASLGLMSPQGQLASPGLMVGYSNTGFFNPSSTTLAAVAAGQEVMRLASDGTLTLGGAPGAHALGVATPAAAVNRLAVTGGAAGQGVAAAAEGSDTNIGLSLAAKGTGTVRLQAAGALAFEAAGAASAVNALRATATVTAGRPSLAAQGSDANIGVALAGKGTGTVQIQAQGAVALEAYGATSAVNSLRVTPAATNGRPALAAQGSDTNVGLTIAGKGTGQIFLQANSTTSLVVAGAASAVNYAQVSGAAAGSPPVISAQGTDTNIALALTPKGTGVVRATAPVELPTYTVAGLPAASGYPRCIAYVSDGTASKRFAISDGTSWRWPDGAVVS